MRTNRTLIFAFLFSLFILLTYQRVKANVELVSFTATPEGNSILIEWETATELDNAGFIVQRSEHPVLDFGDYSPFILARGSGAGGANYEFLDENATVDVTYYYILQAWDINNQYETFGPVSAIIEGSITSTPSTTATVTDTGTATSTATQTNTPNTSWTPTRTLRPSSTSRPTNTTRPTRTYTPAPPTSTPTVVTHTPTNTPSATITPSPTLYDPPEIILALPETETPARPSMLATVTTQPMPTHTPEPDSIFSNLLESGSIVIIGSICLVVLLWAAIAVGIFIYLQKRNS